MTLAEQIARDVFTCGNDGVNRPVIRIEFKGVGRDQEIPMGGLYESALASCIQETLDKRALEVIPPIPQRER